MTYSTVYPNIEAEVVQATKDIVKKGYIKKDNPVDIKLALAELWMVKVCGIYGLKTMPTIVFDPSESGYAATGGGTYNHASKKITMYKKMSLVTFLHEFRHFMQHEMDLEMYRDDHEHDARAWSVSLFKLATPKMYANAVEKGLLHFN